MTSALPRYQMYIGGRWVDSASGEWLETDNPFLGQPWALIPRGSAADVDAAVTAARTALTSGDWPRLTPTRRGALLRRLGDLITERAAALAEIEVRDNGKLLAEMGAQVAYTAQWYHYYGGLAHYRANRPDRMAIHFEQFLKAAPEAPERAEVTEIMRTVRGR
mgnify:CR=1 FL=1